MDVAFDSLLGSLAGPTFLEERLGPMNADQLRTVLAVLEELSPQSAEDVDYWDFERAKEGVLEFLTRPGKFPPEAP